MSLRPQPDGRRAGRRPTRLPPQTASEIERYWRSIDEDGKPAYSPAEIATKLNEKSRPRQGNQKPRWNERTGALRPGDADAPWNAAAVRSALQSIRTQREVLLRRLGSLLAVVEFDDGVAPVDLARLCDQHQVDAYWVWDRWQLDNYLDLESDFGEARFSPPLDVSPKSLKLVVNAAGRRVIELWTQLHAYEPEVLDVLEAMTWSSSRLNSAALFRVCERLGASFDDVLATGLVEPAKDPAGFRLTTEGDTVAFRWRIIVGDEEGLWEYEYWPEPEEEVTLPLDWDWDDRPLIFTDTPTWRRLRR